MSALEPVIGIMILNHNGRRWLPPLYCSIRACGYSNARVYLVDNGSDDDSVAVTREDFPEVTVLQMPHNLGYCMAYNLSTPRVFSDGCDWVVWANNDLLVEPGCLTEMACAAQSDSQIGVLGPGFLGWDSDEPNYYMSGKHPQAIPAMRAGARTPMDVDWVEGSFLMVSRRCVESVGPLDPMLCFYWEETDFCRRARLHGWRVVLVPCALARHYGGGWWAQERARNPKIDRVASRNYYIYYLANPEQSFAKNLIETGHLFLATIKARLRTQPSLIIGELEVFLKVLSMLGEIYAKRRRDRSGGQPPPLTSDLAGVSMGYLK